MSKEELLSNVLSSLDQLGISYTQGQGTDISINCEFLDASWSTGRKSINYYALIFFDEQVQTVFMRELTKESGSGFSFGSDNESFSQTGSTLYRKVKSTRYGPDGKAYEYDLDLGEIPRLVKKSANELGWKFKTVLKKEKAMYPQFQSSAKPKKKKGCLIALLSVLGIFVLLIVLAVTNG